MANHRATDGSERRYSVLDSTDRGQPGGHVSPHAATARPFSVPTPRTVAAPRPTLAASGPRPDAEAVTRTTAVPAGPARRSTPEELRAMSAQRSSADDIAARATTTLIPNSPGDRAKAGPIFVDGSGRRARRFKGLAVAAATLAAGYVGVVVTGALAGATGPVGVGPTPVANGASLAPAAPSVPAPVVPSPIVATPADVTTTPKKAPVKKRTTTKKVVPRTTAPKKIAPAPVVPVPAPVVPVAPAQPVTPPATGNTVPKDQQQPETKTGAENPAALQNA